MFRRLLLAATITAVMPLGAMLAPGAANAATAGPACSGVIAVAQSGFDPPTVPAGQVSTLKVVVQNCTDQTVQGDDWWFGDYTAPGGGLAPGCPVIDPVVQPFTIAPQGSFTITAQIGDAFPTCQAAGFAATVDIAAGGTSAQATADLVIGQATQPPPPPPPPGVCHITYTPNQWPGGFTADVTISNTGTTAINGWTLAFTFPGDQEITSAWNATVTQTGASVSAANLSYNAVIPPGGSQSFGFQGTWTSSDTSPATFSVQGAACS